MVRLIRNSLLVAFLVMLCVGVQSGPILTEVDIEFTHTGDDLDVGTATYLEWKWTTDTLLSWEQWAMITDTITPLISYTLDTAFLSIEFPDNGVYWIGVMAGDEVFNWSPVCIKGMVSLPDITSPGCITGSIINIVRQ